MPKDQGFIGQSALSNQDIPSAVDQQNAYSKSGLYSSQDYQKQADFMAGDPRNDYGKNVSHKRQTSSLHGNFIHAKGHSLSEQSPRRSPKEGMYSTAPDLPPRVDRAVKPLGLLTTPNKIPNG